MEIPSDDDGASAVSIGAIGIATTGDDLGDRDEDDVGDPVVAARERDLRRIYEMHANSAYTAGAYVSVILSCYFLGLLLLLIHHVKTKYGQVTLYDIYLELWPTTSCSKNNGGGGGGNGANISVGDGTTTTFPATTTIGDEEEGEAIEDTEVAVAMEMTTTATRRRAASADGTLKSASRDSCRAGVDSDDGGTRNKGRSKKSRHKSGGRNCRKDSDVVVLKEEVIVSVHVHDENGSRRTNNSKKKGKNKKGLIETAL